MSRLSNNLLLMTCNIDKLQFKRKIQKTGLEIENSFGATKMTPPPHSYESKDLTHQIDQ